MAKKEEKNIKDKTSFIKSFKAELKKVIWPTPKQLLNNTVAVLSIVVIVAVIVVILDLGFRGIYTFVNDKVKESMGNNSVIENVIDNENDGEVVENTVVDENTEDTTETNEDTEPAE